MYVNTWHGTPIKALGYDLPSGGQGTGNVVRNLLQADFLVSASPYMTEQLYARAYQLRNLARARVIEEGYPRIDRQAIPIEEARAVLAGGAEGGGPGAASAGPGAGDPGSGDPEAGNLSGTGIAHDRPRPALAALPRWRAPYCLAQWA